MTLRQHDISIKYDVDNKTNIKNVTKTKKNEMIKATYNQIQNL